MDDKIDTDFGNDGADSTPINSGRLSGINDWIFARMRPKKAVSAKPKKTATTEVPNQIPDVDRVIGMEPIYCPEHISKGRPSNIVYERLIEIPPQQEVQNGLLFPKKSFIEKARDQLKFPQIGNVKGITNGAALLVFVFGAYILYANLPTHPELVVGILLVTIAGNVIINQR